jgi:hypothetical protein
MEFAIFWLPLVASILLGGVAIAAWYGGDRTLAIWAAFVGAIFFLLTMALQVQQHVWRTANQPKLILETLEDAHSFLRWNPPASFQMQINDQPNPPYGAWKVPIFLLRNTGGFAQDATAKWGLTPFDVQAILDSSPRFRAVHVALQNDQVTFGPSNGAGTPFIHPLAWTSSVPLPFLTREQQIFIPLNVLEYASLFFIGTLADAPGARSAPIFFDIQISWNIPESDVKKHFRLKAIAVNAKAPGSTDPNFLANIEFEIQNE